MLNLSTVVLAQSKSVYSTAALHHPRQTVTIAPSQSYRPWPARNKRSNKKNSKQEKYSYDKEIGTRIKSGKREQHFSIVVTNHSSVVTCSKQKKNKRQEQHFSSVVTSIVTCPGQRQQPRTSPRRDQFHLVNKCIISTKQWALTQWLLY